MANLNSLIKSFGLDEYTHVISSTFHQGIRFYLPFDSKVLCTSEVGKSFFQIVRLS